MSLINNIQQRFKYANIVEQLIYVNIAVFIIAFAVKAFATLMQWDVDPFFDWFALPAAFENFFLKPWTIVTYGFLHGGFLHILFNLIVLFYFGNLFLDFFSKKDFLIYYFLGIIIGGLVYLVSYNYFPALKHTNAYLVGASAGIMAIVIGIATKIPNYAMHFRFIGAIKLWYIAVAFIVLDLIQMPINTGGHLAHIGGALVGYLLTAYFSGSKSKSSIVSFFSNIFKKQKPLKTVYKKSKPDMSYKNSDEHQQKIDKILDKISKSGYDALTKEEKDFLFSVGKK